MIGQIITVGTELTRGEIQDSNATWLSAEMVGCGVEMTGFQMVDDNAGRIVDVLARGSQLADVVVCTGGLGPTSDDLTTECAARAAGVGLWRHQPTMEAIRARFDAAGLKMVAINEKQADFPVGATVLPNPVGTAPGFQMNVGRARMYFLPGVPHEMKRLFRDFVAPWLEQHASGGLHQEALRCFGSGESNIAAKLEGIESEFSGVTIGYRATFPEIEVKVLARAESREKAKALSQRAAQKVRERLGELVFADRSARLPEIVGEALRRTGQGLAIAESCTGGLMAELVTAVPGASDYFLLGVVAYSNAAKQRLLGVRRETLETFGAVSAETVREMALGCLTLCDADLAVATSGIAGPTGGTADKPVGLVHLALARRSGEVSHEERVLGGDRFRVRMLGAYMALRMVLRATGERP